MFRLFGRAKTRFLKRIASTARKHHPETKLARRVGSKPARPGRPNAGSGGKRWGVHEDRVQVALRPQMSQNCH